jgi:transcriptional regulator with XRE-family HTH domain
MADTNILAGPALRRLRKRESLTQAAMASILGISPSYLNLIERNQRPLSARVLVQVIERFDFDPRSLREDDAIGGLDGLVRRMADKRFGDLGIDREEVQEFLATAPQIAIQGAANGSLSRIPQPPRAALSNAGRTTLPILIMRPKILRTSCVCRAGRSALHYPNVCAKSTSYRSASCPQK